ncbi:MAG: aspartate aminotransferase family protein [Caldilineaceae bacterium]|nr:aspartate aminotransferase family protein [Caldilineaceae bacterium]
MLTVDQATLLEQDERLLHPMQNPAAHANPVIVESGHGVWLHTADDREIIDGLAGLWNVNIGYGNQELGEVAKEQMSKVAYCSNYAGMSNLPAIELANKLAGYAYPSLKTTFFASGGAEANESAFKTARYYWKRKGQPTKVRVIARQDAYHGITLAAMSATGMTKYWTMFEPRVPEFSHIPAPNPYRYTGDRRPGESVGQAAARALEDEILRLGPDTVAAFIAEPVQGAGGVIVPPADYFSLVRQVCDKYDVLLIADEVITGFGRTGDMFALTRYGIEPDILSFAKGVTSGYLPLGGIQISDEIRDTIWGADPAEAWSHGYTYSGHATACAVALKNIEIIERDHLAANAVVRGEQLRAGLNKLRDEFEFADNVRGLGLINGIEFVKDRESREPAGIGAKVMKLCLERGLWARAINDTVAFSPALVITEEEVDKIIDILGSALDAVAGEV